MQKRICELTGTKSTHETSGRMEVLIKTDLAGEAAGTTRRIAANSYSFPDFLRQ